MWDTPKHYAQRLTEAAWRRATMPMFALLNPGKKGVQPQNPESSLRHLIVRQHEAIHEIVRACQTHLAGLRPIGRPVANFLFLGRAGSRKTRVVEATAEALLKDSRAVIKINCAEFQQGHEIAKLIGPPPGCLGNRETHALLSQEALNRHHRDKVKLSFLLFDEIEKASDALWNLLIGIMNKATLTLGDNRTVDFSATMVFLTSNLGASEMNSLVTARPGFHAPRLRAPVSDASVAAARRRFTPEFINRLDRIVVFKSAGSRK